MKTTEQVRKILWEAKNKIRKLHYHNGYTRKGLNKNQQRLLTRTSCLLTAISMDKAEGTYEMKQ